MRHVGELGIVVLEAEVQVLALVRSASCPAAKDYSDTSERFPLLPDSTQHKRSGYSW